MPQREITGTLEAYREQGLEYPLWTVYDDKVCDIHGKRVLAAQYELKPGDLLIVFSDKARNEVAWHGVIDPDKDAARKLREQKRWNIYDVQRGVEPERWVDMFLQKLPCRVVPAP